MDLKGKVILVTGSSSGIGKAISIVAAQKGAKVLIHFRKNKKGAEDTLKEVKKYSSGEIYQADLSDVSEVKNLFEEFKKESMELDLLVNNAGEAISGELDNFELWESQWKGIFMSQVYVANEFLKNAPSKKLRKIVNMGSIYGLFEMGDPDFPQYSAAKAAVHSFTLNLAKKVAPEVLVNAVAPGWVWTPPWEGTSEVDKEKLTSLTQIKRFIKPEEIAKMVISLLENDAVVGEIIRVDGGLHFPKLLI